MPEMVEHQETQPDKSPRDHHVCPWWMGYLIASPLRKLGENPDKILGPLVEPGMTAVDFGSAMGFFSLPLARMIGPHGRVVCVDLQPRMLSSLRKRARKKGLDDIIETRECSNDDLGVDDLSGQADVALAIHVVHEVPYPRRFLTTCRTVLKPGGRLLLIEPRGHVSDDEFQATKDLAFDVGFTECDELRLRKSHSLVLEAPTTG